MKNFIAFLILFTLIGFGYYYYVRKPADINAVQNDINDAKNTIVNTTNQGIDGVIQSAFKGVGDYSPIYYVQNGRSYGISANQNICNDTTNTGSIGNIISNVEKYTKSISCTVASDYPSRSFTITAPSEVNSGQYYCTDQSGVISLIPNLNYGSFEKGIRCK